MTTNPQPERRFVLELKWGADDRKSMAHALQRIAFEIDSERSSGRVTSGAPSDGGSYELRENQGVTHDSYFAAVNSWLKVKQAEADSQRRPGLMGTEESPMEERHGRED